MKKIIIFTIFLTLISKPGFTTKEIKKNKNY